MTPTETPADPEVEAIRAALEGFDLEYDMGAARAALDALVASRDAARREAEASQRDADAWATRCSQTARKLARKLLAAEAERDAAQAEVRRLARNAALRAFNTPPEHPGQHLVAFRAAEAERDAALARAEEAERQLAVWRDSSQVRYERAEVAEAQLEAAREALREIAGPMPVGGGITDLRKIALRALEGSWGEPYESAALAATGGAAQEGETA